MGLSKHDVYAEIERNEQYLKEVSRFIHSHPEVSDEEYESSQYLLEQLKKLGFRARNFVAGVETAFEATADASAQGPCVCIMTEYDALPITIDGKRTVVAHVCGHNLNSAATIGAAIGVKKALPQLHGRIMIIGAAEESGCARIALLKGGAFKNVDAVLAMHAYTKDKYSVAQTCACGAMFDVEFIGKRATATGTTIDSVNPLDTLTLFLSSLNVLDYHLTLDTLIQRKVATMKGALNVPPLTAVVNIQVRSGDEEYLQKIISKIRKAARGVALATGASVCIDERHTQYHHRIVRNRTLEEVARRNIEETGHKFTYDQPSTYPFCTGTYPFCTGTGNVSRVVPVAQLAIGSPDGINVHTAEAINQSLTDNSQRLVIEAAKILAGTAVDLLNEPKIIEQAKKELSEYRASNFKGTVSWHGP